MDSVDIIEQMYFCWEKVCGKLERCNTNEFVWPFQMYLFLPVE